MASVSPVANSTIRSGMVRYADLPRRPYNHQQVRRFRFSLWSSYLDPAFQKGLQRRHRVVKYKHAEYVNRWLAWDRRLPANGTYSGLKSFVCGSWRGNDPRSGGRYVDNDELKDTTKGSNPDKESRGVADEKHPASDNTFRYREARRLVWGGRSSRWTLLGRESTSTGSFKTTTSESPDPIARHNKEIPRQPPIPSSEEDYDIDPISNRKVFRKKAVNIEPEVQVSDVDVPSIPVRRFRGYQSQFSKFGPPSESNAGKPIHLDRVHPTHIEQPDQTQSGHSELDGKLPEQSDPVSELSGNNFRVAGSSAENIEVQKALKADQELMTPYTGKMGKFNVASRSRWPFQEVLSSKVKGRPGNRAPSIFSTPSLKDEMNKTRDEKQEDLDLLRASDVRAASGIMRGPKNETKAEKEDRRTALEAEFNELQRLNKSPISKTEANHDKESHQIAIAFEIERSYLQNLITHAKSYMEGAKTELETATDKAERKYLLKRMSYATERMEARRAQLAELEKSGRPSNQVEIENWQRDAREAGASTRPEDLHKLTWNFSRDFPEEFSTSWVKKGPSADDFLIPKSDMDASAVEIAPKGLKVLHQQGIENAIQSAENDYATSVSAQNDSIEVPSATRIETALHRTLKTAGAEKHREHDAYKKGPADLKTPDAQSSIPPGSETKMSDKELIQEVRGIYESTYGTIDCEHRQSNLGVPAPVQTPKASDAVQITSSNPRPNPYMLLVANPGLDFVWSAEITSISPETIERMTPTEALLKLSNPVKYLNLLKQFQAEGYEIVSGTENYVVLGKILEESTANHLRPYISASTASPPQRQQVVNPIDGMQRFPHPATGNFASPTGFVNHDLPEDRFISGIDVRREEAVFTGQKSPWQDNQGSSSGFRKKSRKRTILLGAVWLGACSYAVGVVTEYFKTGGSDGTGPVGF